METKNPSLRSVQQWMQAVIMHPKGVNSDELVNDELTIDNMILPSRHLTSQQRIEVYSNAYYARLLECMRDEFSAVVALLGEEIFNSFAFGYLQSYPSASYTLADLGSQFHGFLTDNRDSLGDDDSAESVEDNRWFDFMLDLVLLERTYGEVFSGPGIENIETLDADALSAVAPALVGDICLTPAPCMRLLYLKSRAHEYAIAIRKSGTTSAELPKMVETCLVVTRINYVVRTIVVEPDEFLLLQKLFEGVCLDSAIASVVEQLSLSEEQLAGKLADWFKRWAMDRLFVRFSIP